MVRSERFSERGLTLIELVLVVAIVGIISSLAIARLDSLAAWKVEGDIRKFANTWQFLYHEAFARGESYRLEIDLDRNEYVVFREVRLAPGEVKDVDLLQNLRTRGEQERRREEEQEDLLSLDEEFAEEDRRESDALDSLYYTTRFRDPFEGFRLGRPTEFPSLAERKQFVEGLEIRDIELNGERIDDGRAALRLAPRGSNQFAVVHFQQGEYVYTLVNDPSTGEVTIYNGDRDFSWSPRDEDRRIS